MGWRGADLRGKRRKLLQAGREVDGILICRFGNYWLFLHRITDADELDMPILDDVRSGGNNFVADTGA